MGIRVCKFGGSSVADAGQLRKVRAIIDAEEERRFVVPSAPGKRDASDTKVTDLLYQIHATASEKGSIEPLFDRLAERYHKIVADLSLDFELDSALSEVHDRIRDGAGADYAASRGEYLSGLGAAARSAFRGSCGNRSIRRDRTLPSRGDPTRGLDTPARRGSSGDPGLLWRDA
jgi:aspartate kinase